MSTIIDYMKWRGDVPFSVAPLNPVDAMILCEATYYNYNGLVPADFSAGTVLLGEICKNPVLDPLPNYCTKEDLELCELITESPRFADIKVGGFINRIEEENGMQFCALTFFLNKNLTLVSFRGTDDSLIGWKENMDLAYNEVVPSQKEAVAYLKEAAKHSHGTIVVAGHSKGGNLAVYGSAFSGKRVNKRIEKVYNFDGPGFNDQVIQDERFQEIAERTQTFVPQDSIIGLLLEHKEQYEVVHSYASNGISQHHLVSWEVERDNIIRSEKITKTGENYRENISEWIASMSYEEKRAFIEVAYDLVDDYKTTGELFTLKNIWSVIKDYRAMSDENKKAVSGPIGDFKDTVIDNVKERIDSMTKVVSDHSPKKMIQKGKMKLGNILMDGVERASDFISENMEKAGDKISEGMEHASDKITDHLEHAAEMNQLNIETKKSESNE